MLMEADQPPGKYLFAINGLQDCRHLNHSSVIIYEDGKPDSSPIEPDLHLTEDRLSIAERGYDCHRIAKDVLCSVDLKSREKSVVDETVDERFYIPFDVSRFSNFTDEMTDNSYNIYSHTFYPAFLSMRSEETMVPQVNKMSFKYPPSPILFQSENTPEKSICSSERRSAQCADTPLFCECVQIVQVPPRKTIEIILIDEGSGSNVSQTFHVHGYNVSILSSKSLSRPITTDEIQLLDRDGKLFRNTINPPKKDTFVVPNKGYVILRLFTDNLGYWLWEARSTGLFPGTLGPGMQFLMRVGEQEDFPPVPIGFPTCGNNKGPDLIFETS